MAHNILVIGGTGNIGQAVVKQLAQHKEINVLVGTRDPSSQKAEVNISCHV